MIVSLNYLDSSSNSQIIVTNDNVSIEIIVNQNELNVTHEQNVCFTNITSSQNQTSLSSTSSPSSSISSSLISSSDLVSSSLLSSSNPPSLSSSLFSSSKFLSSSLSSSQFLSSSFVSSSPAISSSSSSIATPSSSSLPGLELCPAYYVANPMSPFLVLNQTFVSNITIYADSTTGNDFAHNGLSLSSPFQSIQAAQSFVRSYLVTFGTHQNVIISLNGIFYLNETLTFNASDSVADGYKVVYTSTNPSEMSKISGGTVLLSNWTQFNNSNIYRLYVENLSVYPARTLVINGIHIAKARTPRFVASMTTPATNPMSDVLDCSTCPFSTTGNATVEIISLANYQSYRCQGQITPTKRLLIDEPCAVFTWSSSFMNPAILYMENSLPFLTTPGTWVSNYNFDGYIYVIPPVGVSNLNNAIVVMSQVQLLAQLTNVQNLVFQHLTWSDSNWIVPDTNVGVTILQGDGLYNQIVNNAFSTFPGNPVAVYNYLANQPLPWLIDVAISCIGCQNVLFSSSIFTRMAASGIRVGDSSQGVMIWNNTFMDNAASCIQIGTGFSSINTVINTVIQGNSFINSTLEFPGAIPIYQTGAVNTLIDSNSFNYAQYSCISIGLNEASFFQSLNSQNNTVTNNQFLKCMQSMVDGAGSYWNTADKGSLVDGNYCAGFNGGISGYNSYVNNGCVYLDTGSGNSTIVTENNIIDETTIPTGVLIYAQPAIIVSPPFSSTETIVTAGVTGLATRCTNPPPIHLTFATTNFLAFGGLYGLGSNVVYYNNILSTGYNCPPTYFASSIYGNGVWPIYLCSYPFVANETYVTYSTVTQTYRFVSNYSGVSVAAYTFGGIYGNGMSNPYTGSESCANNFQSQQFSGTSGFQYNMYVCVKNYTPGDAMSNFGGFYSIGFPNQLTSTQSCSTINNYSPYATFVDNLGYNNPAIYYCISTILSSSSSTGVKSSSSSSILSSSLYSSSFSSSIISPSWWTIANVPAPDVYYLLQTNYSDLSPNNYTWSNVGIYVPVFNDSHTSRGYALYQGAFTGFQGLSNYSLSHTFSLAGWMNPTDYTPATSIGLFGGYSNDVGNSRYYVLALANISSISEYTSVATNASENNNGKNIGVSDDSPILPNQWYHFVMTFDSTSGVLTYYKNGALISSATMSSSELTSYNANLFSTPFLIGGYAYGSLSIYGYLQGIGAWSSVLSLTQVDNLYMYS